MKLHVVHVVYWLRVAGLENGVVNLVNRLEGEQKHTIVCIEDVGPLAARLSDNIEIVDLSREMKRDRFFPLRMSRLFRRLRPDIVHSRNWAAMDAIPAASLARVPRVVHGEHGREASDPTGCNKRRRLIRRMFSPMVDRFVTVSEDLRAWLVADVGISSRKVICIHNGVDVDRFRGGRRQAGRKALGLNDEAVAVGAVGRLEPVKDHATLLEAFARIPDKNPDLHLFVIGDGSRRKELEARAKALDLRDRAHFIGEKDDIPTVLNGLDLYVISSIAEGISNTVLEAMATGLPVVATRVGGNPELVTENINGMLVPVGDAETMADALTRYILSAELRRSHGQASRQRVIDQFSLDRMAEDYSRLYCSLLTS